MRHATALIAAIALGAGCVLQQQTDTGRVDVYWAFWSPSLGNIGTFEDAAVDVCTKAAVDDVRITLVDPARVAREPSEHPCIPSYGTPGAAFTGLEAGTWDVLVEGRRGGVKVFEAWGTFEAADGTRAVVEARGVPPPGNWDVVASYSTGACATGDRLDFDLVDTGGAARRVAFSTHDAAVNPPVSVPCGAGAVTIPSVAPGPYELSGAVQVNGPGTVTYAFATCRPAWTQPADATVTVPVTVTASVPPPDGNAGVCR
ncbi:MAG TPA: hypothetical protein VLT47_05390 [Anaeromyxobacteraceae bacterium]|nr:hypothetical protein [Anaeromyxobacteraceae bacterium]